MTAHGGGEGLAGLVARNFPPIEHSFAYGSGVFAQAGLYGGDAAPGSASGPMLDFIFAVADPAAWHEQNLVANPSHYSFLRLLGPRALSLVAERIGSGVYFNTLVTVEGRRVKYGVLGLPTLLQDLRGWSHLYVAGRMHKPTAPLASHAAVADAQASNLRAALATALLLSPSRASLQELLRRIAALSYAGDVRMGLAEDGRKVERIVAGSRDGLAAMYLPLLQAPPFDELGVRLSAEGVQQPAAGEGEYAARLLATLPCALLARLAGRFRRGTLPAEAEDAAAAVTAAAAESVSAELPQLSEATRAHIAAAALATPQHTRRLLQSSLRGIVAASSTRQAVAGMLYAGPLRSLRYLGAKLVKAWR